MSEITDITVKYKGKPVGVVVYDPERNSAAFEYYPNFIKTGIELAPVMMPLRRRVYQFASLHKSFSTLPGLLADCLPDTYGNALINQWLSGQNRKPNSFTVLERLAYMGSRSMGALEFEPSLGAGKTKTVKVVFEELIDLASKALQVKQGLGTALGPKEDLEKIISVGTSAGGARAKAVIAWNEQTGDVVSGQGKAPEGYSHWLLKFDGVSESFEGIRDPQGYGRIEYAYYLMALEAGINMSPSRLHEEGGRAHFMTKRFDRIENNQKVHYASLFGLKHMAYTDPGDHNHAYDDLFELIDTLALDVEEKRQAFRRMVFNVMSCNRDDHVKNFGFLMDDSGSWALSPAFDVAYAHNPSPGAWTNHQQMSVNGKRTGIKIDDLIACGRMHNVGTINKLKSIIGEVESGIKKWPEYADRAGVDSERKRAIQNVLASSAPHLHLIRGIKS